MKLCCDLCGGTLRVNSGGQSATCCGCGVTYPMERLREKLQAMAAPQAAPAVPQAAPVAQPAQKPAFQPQQFFMQVGNFGNGDVNGLVQQGGIGLGDDIYIDGDYAHPYRVYDIISNGQWMVSVKAGMPAELSMVKCPRKVLKNARFVTGALTPVANAYNYPGPVRQYFIQLLESEFPGFEIRENVPHPELKIPVSLMLCRSGMPALALMLVDSNDSAARYQAKKAAMVFGREGIGCTHFFENYRNDTPYVIDRVRRALG